ncbi:MAG TPA: hypothetical protein VH559_02700 [Gemmatimonadaceae bacterium]|jgi:hypothetical protein
MPPCHTTPFIKPGIAIAIAPAHHTDADNADADNTGAECCDYCGSERLEWRKCKLVCNDCRQINKSCADL